MNDKFTILFIPWDDIEGKPRFAGRFKTVEEKDKFLSEIYKSDSGWVDIKPSSLTEISDYNYSLCI